MAAATDRKTKIKEIDSKIGALGEQLVNEIDAQQNPHIDIPIRGSSNVFYDEKAKKIMLGDKVARRHLFNVSHARRFMQTLLVASYVKKDLLGNDLTATLRDLYYAKKHTIPGTKEDTIDEQKESDMAIVDLEVSLDTFRERLHLRAEPKGRMAGTMKVKDRVRDKVDTIDLERMGSGGWAIPSIVEQIEFVDYDVNYVLVAEKNAIFDRLNEDGYWKRNKCILITTAGQAARGARRLLQRLSSELKLPIYCLSVDGKEPLLVKDYDGTIKRPLIGDFVDQSMAAYGIQNQGFFEKSMAFGTTVQVDSSGRSTVSPLTNAVRHKIKEPLIEVESESGFSVRVTPSHSLKVFDSEHFEIVSRRANELKPTDYLISNAKVPMAEGLRSIDLHALVLENKETALLVQGRPEGADAFVPVLESTAKPAALRHGKSELQFKPTLDLTPELGRLLGYYASEGHLDHSVTLTFGPHEEHYAKDALACASRCFGIMGKMQKAAHSLRVLFGGQFAELVFEKILAAGKGAENKRVPWVVYNAPAEVKKEFLRGYFRGDGNLRFSARGCVLWAPTVSRALASDLVFLIRQLGGWATVYKRKSKKANEKDAYCVGVRDKTTLRTLSDTVLDLAKNNRDSVWSYLNSPVRKLAVNKSVPSDVVKRVQKAIYLTTRHGTSPLANNQKRIAFAKLEPLLQRLGENPASVLIKDKLLETLPLNEQTAVSTSRVAESNETKFITAFKALKRFEKKGLVRGVREKGNWKWFRTGESPALSAEDVRRLLVVKNIVDHQLVLLKPKRLNEVTPTSEWVYDIEVSPAHTFTCGVGDLLVSNTDSDPYGWYIYSTMKYGSMALAHESERLGCREMKFLGMSTSDIEHYDLSAVTIKAKEVDIKRAQEMQAYDWFKSKEWQSEIKLFLQKKLKAEIQALSSKNLQYISNTYLPEKIANQEFLP